MLCFRSRLLSIKSSWCACFSALLGNQPCKRIIQLVTSWVPPLLRQNNIRVKDSLLPIGVTQIVLEPCFQWKKQITINDLKQLPSFHNCSRFAPQMKLASVLIRVAIFKNGNVLNNIERDISGLKFFKSLYSSWHSYFTGPAHICNEQSFLLVVIHFSTRGDARAYHELLQEQGYANESLTRSLWTEFVINWVWTWECEDLLFPKEHKSRLASRHIRPQLLFN